MTKKFNIPVIFLIIFVSLTVFFYLKIPKLEAYSPIFSKKFPLSTPISFWASMLGMRRLAADIVWIQTLQYYGESNGYHSPEIHKHSGHTTEKTTSLYTGLLSHWQQIIRFDPLFVHAYLLGPTTLGWNLKRYDEAMELLDEGIETVENISKTLKNLDILETDEKHPLIVGKGYYFEELKWKLYTLKAVLIFLHQEKFNQAIPLLEKIAFRKDTPDEIKVILAQVYEAKNDYKKAVKLWLNIYSTTTKESRKISAGKNLIRLKNLK